jgi:hypothetical protein
MSGKLSGQTVVVANDTQRPGNEARKWANWNPDSLPDNDNDDLKEVGLQGTRRVENKFVGIKRRGAELGTLLGPERKREHGMSTKRLMKIAFQLSGRHRSHGF